MQRRRLFWRIFLWVTLVNVVIVVAGILSCGFDFGNYIKYSHKLTAVQWVVVGVGRIYVGPADMLFKLLHEKTALDIFVRNFFGIEICDIQLGPGVNLFYILPYAFFVWVVLRLWQYAVAKGWKSQTSEDTVSLPGKKSLKSKLVLLVCIFVVPLIALADRMLNKPSLPGGIDRIVLFGTMKEEPYKGPVEIFDPVIIDQIVNAVENSVRDPGIYDDVKDVAVEFYSGDKLVFEIVAESGFGLFNIDGAQFNDKARRLRRLLLSPLKLGKALIGSWSIDKKSWSMGEAITGRYFIRNAGRTDETVPGRVTVNVQWFEPYQHEGIKGWRSDEQMIVEIESSATEYSNSVLLDLAPITEARYRFTIPSEKIGSGKFKLRLSFGVPADIDNSKKVSVPLSDFYRSWYIVID